MNRTTKGSLWILWLAAAVFGSAGIWNRFVHGHHDANYGSYIVWGLWVSAYVYYMGLSAGSFLLAAAVFVLRIRRLEQLGKLMLLIAFVTLCMGLLCIAFDLGRMERGYRVMTSTNFHSMMGWMGWLYSTYLVLLLFALWHALRVDLAAWTVHPDWRGRVGRLLSRRATELDQAAIDDSRRWLRWLCMFGVPLAVMFNGGVGALLGTISARSYWHTPLMPFLFLFGAMVSGSALVAFATAAFWPRGDGAWRAALALLAKIVVGLLVFDLLLEWAEISIPLWYGVGHEADLIKRVLFGEYWYVFWILHILIGSAIPLWLLLAHRHSPRAVGLAGLLVMVTFLSVRLNMIVPGLVDPNLHELQNAFTDRRLVFQYLPSVFEWQVTIAFAAIGSALFYLIYRFLPVAEERRLA